MYVVEMFLSASLYCYDPLELFCNLTRRMRTSLGQTIMALWVQKFTKLYQYTIAPFFKSQELFLFSLFSHCYYKKYQL